MFYFCYKGFTNDQQLNLFETFLDDINHTVPQNKMKIAMALVQFRTIYYGHHFYGKINLIII